jgi:hypothetical protein
MALSDFGLGSFTLDLGSETLKIEVYFGICYLESSDYVNTTRLNSNTVIRRREQFAAAPALQHPPMRACKCELCANIWSLTEDVIELPVQIGECSDQS